VATQLLVNPGIYIAAHKLQAKEVKEKRHPEGA